MPPPLTGVGITLAGYDNSVMNKICECTFVYNTSTSLGVTIDISLERRDYFVNESSGFVEVCVVLGGLGVVEGIITVDILTESISATGKPTQRVSDR